MEVNNVSQGRQATVDTNSSRTTMDKNTVVDNIATKQPVNKLVESIENNNPTEKEVKHAVEKMNKLLEDSPSHVEYEIYGKHRNMTIKIVDDVTKKVIKEIPPRKIIDMINKLCELAGVLVDEKA